MGAVAAVTVGVVAADELGVARAERAAVGVDRKPEHFERATVRVGQAAALRERGGDPVVQDLAELL